MNTFSRDLLQGMKEAAEFAEGRINEKIEAELDWTASLKVVAQ